MTSSPICASCATSSSLWPCLTIYMGILFVNGSIVHCYILIKTLPNKQKANWHLHIPSLVFTYNAIPHSITDYQPYGLMFGCKAPIVYDAWLGLASYNDNASISKCAWLNEQHELLMSANRWALKHIRQSAKKSQNRAGGKTLHIPIGNLVLLRYHPWSQNKIQDNYKSELFVVVAHQKDPNVYIIQSINKKGTKEQSTGNTCSTWKNLRRILHQYIPVSRDLCMNQNWKKLSNPKFVTPSSLGQRPRQPQCLSNQ